MASQEEIEEFLCGGYKVDSVANWSLFIDALLKVIHHWKLSKVMLLDWVQNLAKGKLSKPIHSSGLKLWLPRWLLKNVLHPGVQIEHHSWRYFWVIPDFHVAGSPTAETCFCMQLWVWIFYASGYCCNPFLDPRWSFLCIFRI